MSMLLLSGQIINVFQTAPYTDKQTGEIKPSRHRVQVMCQNVQQNGQKRVELVNLTVSDPRPFEGAEGRQVRIPVGAMVVGGAVQYYAIKGEVPQVAAPAGARS
jgi:hypothetical protein